MSPSILDCNSLLITEKANHEPDRKVEDQLLQSVSEDEDKDRQPSIPLNELTNKRTKTSEQKSRRKPSHVKQTQDSHIEENPAKRARHVMNSEETISEEAILKLETHRQKQTCLKKFLRYDAKAKIRADEEFKEEIKTIRKQAEQRLLGALIKFHHRSIDSNKIHLNKVFHKEHLAKVDKKAVNRSEHENNLDFELQYCSNVSYHLLSRRVSFLSRRVSFLSRRVSFHSSHFSFLASALQVPVLCIVVTHKANI